MMRRVTSARRSPPPARAKFLLAQPPARTMPKPNMSPPMTWPNQLNVGDKYMDCVRSTNPAACKSCAPTRLVTAARIQARKRRQSSKVMKSEIEPMVQKLVR